MFHLISPWQGVRPYASGLRTRVGSIFLYSLAPGFRKWPVAAARVSFFKTSNKRHRKEKTRSALRLQQLSPPLKKCHFHRRGQVNFKNVILTEHGEAQKNMLHTEHGKQILELQHLRSETTTFFSPFIPQRGAKN